MFKFVYTLIFIRNFCGDSFFDRFFFKIENEHIWLSRKADFVTQSYKTLSYIAFPNTPLAGSGHCIKNVTKKYAFVLKYYKLNLKCYVYFKEEY